jgi:arsenate reductase
MSMVKKRILFICTGNSARSQIAEALMNRLGSDRYIAFSAGSSPAGYVHPLAIRAMQQMHLDISHQTSKSIDLYLHEPWDVIITVCDNAKEACPIFPGQKIAAHWGFEDPAGFEGTDEQKLEEFIKTAVEIEERIRLLLALEEHLLPHNEYHQAIVEIGQN